MAKSEKLPPIHPQEKSCTKISVEAAELGLSMNRLALDLHVPVTRIAEIVHQRRGVTTARDVHRPAMVRTIFSIDNCVLSHCLRRKCKCQHRSK